MQLELHNPYRLPTPLQISFSGGRTSGYMLWHILEAFGGTLPADVKVTFFNTGKEREETLVFVHEIETRWNVPVVWLEYDRVKDDLGEWHVTYRVVDFGTASRNGEPFEKVIASRNFLPNAVMRFCTSELKVKTGRRYLVDQGWEHWHAAIGIRADEPKRHANKSEAGMRWERHLPLLEAGAVTSDVMHFWSQQSFDLQLQPDEGNCDFCFLKGVRKLVSLMHRRPEAVEWWKQQEDRVAQTGLCGSAVSRFHSIYTMEQMKERALGGPLFCNIPQNEDDEVEDCNCTD